MIATDTLIAGTLKSQRGKGGGGIGPEETLIASVPMSQRIHETDGPGPTLTSSNSPNRGGSEGPMIAAPLTKGSASGEGVNAPGRRQEDDVNIVSYSITLASDPISARELAQPSTKRNGDPGVVSNASGVRRLTPRECERLQGLPDDWTLIDPKTPDSRRYSALGDAVTAPVAEWIGARL